MKGKYKNRLVHAVAHARRESLRSRITTLIDWNPLRERSEGCTAIIAVCSKLPDILMANLRCLATWKWPELKEVILVFDCPEGSNPIQKEEVTRAFPGLNIRCFYYSPEQYDFTETYKIGYLFSWLSWCIGIKHTQTEHIFIHDYDALILGGSLAQRYLHFKTSKAKAQGITWYIENGFAASDRLVTTFEAFMDAVWLRSFPPVTLFNKFRIVEGRSLDFDTTLDLQFNYTRPNERSVVPMSLDELVHPSQMICQYTMFRRYPGRALPCFSIPMIPFFYYLGGKTDAFKNATDAVVRGHRKRLDLIGDHTHINLSMLNVAHVDWILKQIVQACCALSIPPAAEVYDYGEALYSIIGADPSISWKGEFADKHRTWIGAAKVQTQDAVSVPLRRTA